MLRKLSLLLLTLAGFTVYGQDVTATLTTTGTLNAGKDLTIQINVNKAGVSGFMKYFMEIPTGYTATDIDSKGGNFTFADNGAKIIWISPPTADQFSISYKITAPASASGSITLAGKFSYVVGNERKSFDIPSQTLTVGGGAVASTPVVKETPKPVEEKPIVKEEPKPTPVEPTPVVKEEPKPTPVEPKPVVKEEPKPTPVEPKPVVKEEPKPTPVEPKPVVKEEPKPAPVVKAPATTTPTAAAGNSIPGRSYRVQIGAFNLKPTITGVPEPSTVQLDNGMTKYFSGNFKTYEEAVKRKNEMLNKGFQGAFIVGFENGKIVK